MMPCILRRQTMEGDLPWQLGTEEVVPSVIVSVPGERPRFHVAGFVVGCSACSRSISGVERHWQILSCAARTVEEQPCAQVIGIAFVIMALRYSNVGQLLGTAGRRSQEGQSLLLAVRLYLRKQWLHFASLAFCSVLILIDTMRDCREDVVSYVTSIGFAGLGLFLSIDRLVGFARDGRRRADIGPVRDPLAVETTELTSPRLRHHSSSRLPHGMSASIQGAEGYRLLDFSSLLEQLIQYLRDEELQLGQQLQLLGHGLDAKQAADAQSAILRSAACLDDNPEMQWDCTITGSSDTTLTVIAPRSFAYLRRLSALDGQKLVSELLCTNVAELRRAAKSGCSLLLSADSTTFVLKTISKSEVKQLRAMLGPYRKHLEQHPGSLLCPIYGCFSFRNSLGYFLHAVLMDCLTGVPSVVSDTWPQ